MDYKKMYLEERIKVIKLQIEIMQIRYDQMQKALVDTERELKNHNTEKKLEEEKQIENMMAKPTQTKSSKRRKRNEKKD